MNKFLKYSVVEPKEGDKRISYSQFAMYSACPKHWELAYAKGLRTFSQSIHTIFGTAFHETLQTYISTMYKDSVKAADELDLHKLLRDNMASVYKKAIDETKEHFSTKFELGEFYNDGVAILDWFKSHRGAYFSKKGYELVGIEMPLYTQAVDGNKDIKMLAYLDIVLRDTVFNKIEIIDIKTSTRGWNKWQKADKIKSSQLVLYKEYFAKQYGFSADMIDIKYLIVKRKLFDGAMFPQKRVQEFIPASGKPTRNKLLKEINEFINVGFKDDGSYNLDNKYLAVPGKNNKSCKFCEFKDNQDLCPKENRIRE